MSATGPNEPAPGCEDEENRAETRENDGENEEGDGEETKDGASTKADRNNKDNECETPEQLMKGLRLKLEHARQNGRCGEARAIEFQIKILMAGLKEFEKQAQRAIRKQENKYLKPMAGYYTASQNKPIKRNLLTSTLKHLGYFRGRRTDWF